MNDNDDVIDRMLRLDASQRTVSVGTGDLNAALSIAIARDTPRLRRRRLVKALATIAVVGMVIGVAVLSVSFSRSSNDRAPALSRGTTSKALTSPSALSREAFAKQAPPATTVRAQARTSGLNMCGSSGATATVSGRLPIDLLNCAAVAAGAAGFPTPMLAVADGAEVQVSGGLVTASGVELIARPEGGATVSRLPGRAGWLIVPLKPGTISVIAADIYICGGATPCTLLQVKASNG